MNRIKLVTEIAAGAEKCFNMSLSVDLHLESTKLTNEKVIRGRKSGMLELGEEITWRARHFGVYQNLKVKISELDRPHYFVDEMVKGAFKSMKHKHEFKEVGNSTLMTDTFEFESPLGIVGRLFDKLILVKYMTKFLERRNEVLKQMCEMKNNNA